MVARDEGYRPASLFSLSMYLRLTVDSTQISWRVSGRCSISLEAFLREVTRDESRNISSYILVSRCDEMSIVACSPLFLREGGALRVFHTYIGV
jgi:hypothetical protein